MQSSKVSWEANLANPDTARILIVDDEELNVDVLKQDLGDLGFETDTAYGGQEALDKVAASKPDLILLDVMMPDIDGITVCRTLKEDPVTQLIPIVIMTALHETEDRVRGIEAGADDFLTKPVDDRELIARINTLLKTKRVVDQTVDELHSASAQLERMGSHEEDLSIIAISLNSVKQQDGPSTLDRYHIAFSDVIRMFSGEIFESDGETLMAAVRTSNDDTHPRLAAEAGLAVLAEADALNHTDPAMEVGTSVGISSGLATVGSQRTESGDGARWKLSVLGSVVEEAIAASRKSSKRGIYAGEGFRERTESRFLVDASSGALSVLTDDPSFTPTDPAEPGSLLWPAEYADLQSATFDAWGITDLYLHRVLSGKSGALVYAVDITARDFAGQAILKLTDLDDPDWSEADEATRHRNAIETNPQYAEQHLPEVVATFKQDLRLASLATIAARGLEYTAPWAHCAYDVQSDSGIQLSTDLLEDWNHSYQFADGMITPADLLASWLAYRLDPAEGRLHSLLEEDCGIRADDLSFSFEGHWYPNPLVFALNTPEVTGNLALRAIVGNMHGDLHGYNVLVGQDHRYHLIDLAFYRPDAFLLYDHGYFEISHLLNTRGGVGFGEWMTLVDALERGSTPYADDVGLVQLLAAVREQVSAWIDRHEPNRLSYLESQFMLGRVGAGMNFANKRMEPPLRKRALLYAAHCLKSYLKFHKVDWPREGDPIRLVEDG